MLNRAETTSRPRDVEHAHLRCMGLSLKRPEPVSKAGTMGKSQSFLRKPVAAVSWHNPVSLLSCFFPAPSALVEGTGRTSYGKVFAHDPLSCLGPAFFMVLYFFLIENMLNLFFIIDNQAQFRNKDMDDNRPGFGPVRVIDRAEARPVSL